MKTQSELVQELKLSLETELLRPALTQIRKVYLEEKILLLDEFLKIGLN